MGEPGVSENLPSLAAVLLMDQNPARQHAERALDDAHVLVQHQMMDVGAVEQGADRRHQHDIVGSQQFPQLECSLTDTASWPRGACQPLDALAASPGSFYCYSRG